MSETYMTSEQVASRLTLSRRDVYALIRTGDLEAVQEALGRPWLITERSVNRYAARRAGIVLSRRSLLKSFVLMGFSWIGGGLTGFRISDAIERDRADESARELFRALFSVRDGGRPFDLSYGRPAYRRGYHPYHLLAGAELVSPLGLWRRGEHVVEVREGLPRQHEGDLIVIGGPNSTAETAFAWGFDEGSDTRELKRTGRPSVPQLRWWGVSARSEIGEENSDPVYYEMGDGPPAVTENWPLVDEDQGVRLVPKRSGSSIIVNGRRAYLPANNYLLLSRLPNFFDAKFTKRNADAIPQLLVIQGTHGVGTLAVELLTRGVGLQALEQLSSKLGVATAFQALFQVFGLERVGPNLRRFTKIRFIDAHELPSDQASYQRLHLDWWDRRTP